MEEYQKTTYKTIVDHFPLAYKVKGADHIFFYM
jgi:hypothetical protein